MTTRWRGSLGLVTDRLRRSLGWTSAGPEVELEFPPPPIPLQPVVLLDDALRPGTATYRGRRFFWLTHVEGVAAESSFWLKCKAPLGAVIDRAYVQCLEDIVGSVHMSIRYNPPGTLGAPPATVAGGTAWMERPKSDQDLPPFEASNEIVSAPLGIPWWLGIPAPSGSEDFGTQYFDIGGYMELDSYLAVGPEAAMTDGNYIVGVYGRIF